MGRGGRGAQDWPAAFSCASLRLRRLHSGRRWFAKQACRSGREMRGFARRTVTANVIRAVSNERRGTQDVDDETRIDAHQGREGGAEAKHHHQLLAQWCQS